MTKKPHFVDLADLGSETLSLKGVFPPGAVDFSGDDLVQLEDLVWSATVEMKGGGARLAGELKTKIQLSCGRCVEPVEENVERRFDLFFEMGEDELFRDNDDIELEESDTSTDFIVGTELAMGEVLREQVLLEVPMKPLCNSDCRGLCASCGANLNRGACDCDEPVVNPAFEPLLEFKKRLEGESGSVD